MNSNESMPIDTMNVDLRLRSGSVDQPVRVLGLLLGDIHDQQSDAPIKYGYLFAALKQRCNLIDVRNVELQGLDRYQAAFHSIRWPPARWREAFYKSVWAFQQRSHRIDRLLVQYRGRVDVILQHGALFTSAQQHNSIPMVIYTDFTYRLARVEDPWRVPFTAAEDAHWDALEYQAYKRAAFILTRSEYVRHSLVYDYGIDPKRVAVVGGGVNVAVLPLPEPLHPAPRILFVGKDFERKGGDQLVAAFRQLHQRLPEAELWLVTGRSDIVGSGIRCIAPIYDREAMAALYRSCSVFAMPSRCETWGDVFLEAMAYGLPCIGSTNDAMPEIIAHGYTGYVVDVDDLDALSNYLELLLTNEVLRQKMGAYGRERAVAQFTWNHVVQRIVPYLEQCVA